MSRIKKVLVILLVSTFFFPLTSSAARRSEPEELDRLIKKINERQSKNLKEFEKKAKAYFFEAQKTEIIEILIKEFPPGEAVTVIIFSNLSKKSVTEVVSLKKSGLNWQDMAGKLNIKLKTAVKEVKDFRSGIG